MEFAIGKKEKMTQMFDSKGVVQPATIISFGLMKVTQVKTPEKDGYNSIQVGYGNKSKKNINKAVLGVMKGEGFEGLKEFKTEDSNSYSSGDEIKLNFQEGDVVAVSSVSKGKGFQGVVKKYGFHGTDATHGQKHSLRKPGSIGAGGQQRVSKGKKMPGRMGSNRITERGKKILKIDFENNMILVKGSIPGRRGSLVEIKKV